MAKFESSSDYNVDYYLTDHLGSVVTQVDYTGAVKVRNLYRPWGEKLASSVAGDRENQFCYTGQLLDEELSRDLAYYGKRYYDGGLKIFTSPDPKGYLDPATGGYVYCRNNPMKFVDPEGEVAWIAALLAAAYIVLATPDNVQAPTQPGEHVEQTFGEKAIQWVAAVAGAAGIIKGAAAVEGKAAAEVTEAGVKTTLKNDLTGPKGGTSWTTARKEYWKGEASVNPANYSEDALGRMEKGLAPQRIDPKTGKPESMELHHKEAVRDGGSHTRENLQQVYPSDHAKIDPYRRVKP